MADDCDLESVREFILSKGGKIRNADLVTRYRRFLDNPNSKVANREKFKDIVNTLATIKKDESGEKVLVLKKKYRGGSMSSSQSTTSLTSPVERANSEPPKQGGPANTPAPNDPTPPPRAKSEGQVVKKGPAGGGSVETVSSVSTADSSISGGEEEDKSDLNNMSVKERAQHLNKIESQSLLERVPQPVNNNNNNNNNTTGRRKDKGNNDGDEDSQCGYMSLGPKELEWLLTCCSADYQPMAKMLTHTPTLAKIRDITNTALHWAAKHGKPEVVKLIAGSKQGVNVNQRSGYTPLHLAAMQGHDGIIDLLVNTYKANPNIRDYSGKKAKHYLRNSASSRAQLNVYESAVITELLMSRRQGGQPPITTSLSDSFLRSASFRKSRSKALSSFMISQFGSKAQPVIRKSWEGSDGEGDVFDPRKTPPSSGRPSPQVRRKASLQLPSQDSRLMPPPSGHVMRKKSRSGSRETSPGSTQFSRSGSDPSLRSSSAKSNLN